jgi:hypothetical protein
VFPLYNAIMLYATAVNNSVAAGYTTPDGTSLSSYFLTNTYYKGKYLRETNKPHISVAYQ